MSATATVLSNRAPRKQLSDQLDRLDAIIDVLAEGLPEAVAQACREGARQAVKDAVVEILTNPELRALFQALNKGAAPAPTRAPGLWSRLKAKVTRAKESVTGTLTRAKEALTARLRPLTSAVSALSGLTSEPLPWKRVLCVGAGVGVAVGVTCLVAPHAVAATIGALGAAATSVAVQTAHWLRTGARRLGLI